MSRLMDKLNFVMYCSTSCPTRAASHGKSHDGFYAFWGKLFWSNLKNTSNTVHVGILCSLRDMTWCYFSPLLRFKVLLRSNYWYSFFLHFRVQYDFRTYLVKFQSITNIRSRSFFTFISKNLRPPLVDLVPRLGCELEKMTSFSQKYLTG